MVGLNTEPGDSEVKSSAERIDEVMAIIKRPRPTVDIGILSPQELESAYWFWWRHYRFQEADALVKPVLAEDVRAWTAGVFGWLRLARRALNINIKEMAFRLGISRQAYTRLENSELQGQITLSKLQEVAIAMNCELVFAIRPSTHQSFSRVIWQQIYPGTRAAVWVRDLPNWRRAAHFASRVRDRNPEVTGITDSHIPF